MSDIIIDRDSLRNFLTERLELSNEDLALLQTEKVSFLNKLIAAYDCHIPFQNYSHTSVPFEQRRIPSYEENIQDVFAGIGGCCWTLNYVMYTVLKTLGFNVKPIPAGVSSYENIDHLMILVNDLVKEGDHYLIDVGFSNTAHQVIPLDFEEVSPIYEFGYQTLRWVKRDDFYIRQEQFDPDIGPFWPTFEENWSNAIFFTLNNHTLDEIKDSIEISVYKNPKAVFNNTRRITGINKTTKSYIAIKDNKLYRENNGKLETERLDNDDEILKTIKNYFTEFPLEIIKASLLQR